MLRVIVGRIVVLVPMLFLVSLGAFLLIKLVPGDPALTLAGDNPTPDQVAAIRAELDLDDPLPQQYAHWIGDAVRGDLGKSLFSSVKVSDAIQQRLPVTLSLAVGAFVVAIVIGLPAGILAATRRGRLADKIVTAFSSLGIALPAFWVAVLLVTFLAIRNKLLPAVGFVGITEDPIEWARHLVLPSLALGTVAAAEIAQQVRASMVDVLRSDYIRTARAMGMRERTVIGRYALRNALGPSITVAGLQLVYFLGGTVVVENIFGLSGIGSLAISAADRRDFPVLQGVVLVAVVVALSINLLVDLTYSLLDPRVRHR
jgi:peptide/nickel transport system permease protein